MPAVTPSAVEAYISTLPPRERALLLRLRSLLLEEFPGFTERLAYGVPYYYGNRRACFLWPASSPLASHPEGVQLGFCYGHLLPDPLGQLERGARKQVYLVTITREADIKEAAIRELVRQAVLLDMQQFGRGVVKSPGRRARQ